MYRTLWNQSFKSLFDLFGRLWLYQLFISISEQICEAFYVRGPLVWEFHVPLGSKFRQNMVLFSKICVKTQCYDHQIIYQKCTRCHQIACTFSKILGGDTPNPPRARGKGPTKPEKVQILGHPPPIIFSFLRHWRVMMFFAYGEGHEHSHLWWGPWTFVIFNGEGHELQYCHLPTFRGPPGALNNDCSLMTFYFAHQLLKQSSGYLKWVGVLIMANVGTLGVQEQRIYSLAGMCKEKYQLEWRGIWNTSKAHFVPPVDCVSMNT